MARRDDDLACADGWPVDEGDSFGWQSSSCNQNDKDICDGNAKSNYNDEPPQQPSHSTGWGTEEEHQWGISQPSSNVQAESSEPSFAPPPPSTSLSWTKEDEERFLKYGKKTTADSKIYDAAQLTPEEVRQRVTGRRFASENRNNGGYQESSKPRRDSEPRPPRDNQSSSSQVDSSATGTDPVKKKSILTEKDIAMLSKMGLKPEDFPSCHSQTSVSVPSSSRRDSKENQRGSRGPRQFNDYRRGDDDNQSNLTNDQVSSWGDASSDFKQSYEDNGNSSNNVSGWGVEDEDDKSKFDSQKKSHNDDSINVSGWGVEDDAKNDFGAKSEFLEVSNNQGIQSAKDEDVSSPFSDSNRSKKIEVEQEPHSFGSRRKLPDELPGYGAGYMRTSSAERTLGGRHRRDSDRETTVAFTPQSINRQICPEAATNDIRAVAWGMDDDHHHDGGSSDIDELGVVAVKIVPTCESTTSTPPNEDFKSNTLKSSQDSGSVLPKSPQMSAPVKPSKGEYISQDSQFSQKSAASIENKTASDDKIATSTWVIDSKPTNATQEGKSSSIHHQEKPKYQYGYDSLISMGGKANAGLALGNSSPDIATKTIEPPTSFSSKHFSSDIPLDTNLFIAQQQSPTSTEAASDNHLKSSIAYPAVDASMASAMLMVSQQPSWIVTCPFCCNSFTPQLLSPQLAAIPAAHPAYYYDSSFSQQLPLSGRRPSHAVPIERPHD